MTRPVVQQTWRAHRCPACHREYATADSLPAWEPRPCVFCGAGRPLLVSVRLLGVTADHKDRAR
jgi:hypothetical protein